MYDTVPQSSPILKFVPVSYFHIPLLSLVYSQLFFTRVLMNDAVDNLN